MSAMSSKLMNPQYILNKMYFNRNVQHKQRKDKNHIYTLRDTENI